MLEYSHINFFRKVIIFMKKILELFRLDWKRIFKSKMMPFLLIGLIILACLYCWVNVWALWDPNSNAGNLKVAVYSNDQAITVEGKKIAIGDELMKELKHNDSLKWVFEPSKKQLDKDVKSGKVYAGIYVPKNFSENLTSILKGKIVKPTLVYSVNKKINAISPKMTDVGATTLQKTISDQFIELTSSTALKTLKKAGLLIDDNLPTIRKFKSLILETDNNLPELQSDIDEIGVATTKLPEIKSKLNQANDLTNYIPALNQDAQKIVTANNYLPLADQIVGMTPELKAAIPDIQNAGSQIQQVDSDFSTISATMDKTIRELKTGLSVLTKVQKVVPKVTDLSNQIQGTTKDINNKLIPELKKAIPEIKNTITIGLNLVNVVASEISQDTANLANLIDKLENSEDLATLKADIKKLLNDIADKADTLQKVQTNLMNTLIKIRDIAQNAGKDTTVLNSIIDKLNAQIIKNQLLRDKARYLANNIDNLSLSELKSLLKEISSLSNEIVGGVNDILQLRVAEVANKILDQVSKELSSANSILGDVNTTILPEIPGLLTDTKSILDTALQYLTKYQKQLPALGHELHTANTLLNGNMSSIVSGINLANDFYNNDYPTLKEKLGVASFFVQYRLPGLEQDLTRTLDLVNSKMPKLESTLYLANDFAANEWPTVKDGIHKTATFLRGDEAYKKDAKKFMKVINGNAKKQSDFFAHPVAIKENIVYNIPNNGSASAPFYTVLCIWVVSLLLSSILSFDIILDKKQQQRYGTKTRFFGRYLTFTSLVMAQAAVVSLGNIFILKTYVVHPVALVFTTMFVGWVFASILYSIIAVFGLIGKAIGVVILVLSISAGGGNYPVVLSSSFFQAVNPFLPFTYAVNLVREMVGGIYWPNARLDFIILVLFAIGFLTLGVFLVGPLKPIVEKIEEEARKGMILE